MKVWLTVAVLVVVLVGAGIAWVVTENHAIDRRLAGIKLNPDLGLNQPTTNTIGGANDVEHSEPTQRAPTTDEPRAPISAAPSPLPEAMKQRPAAAAPPRPDVVPSPPPSLPQQDLLVPKPVARAALGFVGADPEAEAVWTLAINDPDRSPNERKDLIEDLNEDGFPDPKHITPDDLPLILSRLELIEELAPDSIDEVNAAAFAEAYKDLVNMLAKLAQ